MPLSRSGASLRSIPEPKRRPFVRLAHQRVPDSGRRAEYLFVSGCRTSDLAFEVPFREAAGAAWIYILLEHQSEPDRTMPLRLLGYMVQLWQGQRRCLEESHTRD